MLKIFHQKKIFCGQKNFFGQKFFSRFGFVILIGPLFHPQNDIPNRRPCKTRFFCGKGSSYNIILQHQALKICNSHLEMKNGLQSVFWPFGPSTNTNNIKNIICQSIFSLFWILRPTRWDRLWRQVQIMTNQTEFSRAELEQHFTSSLSSYLLCKYR